MSGNRYMTFGSNFERTPGTEKEIKANVLVFSGTVAIYDAFC